MSKSMGYHEAVERLSELWNDREQARELRNKAEDENADPELISQLQEEYEDLDKQYTAVECWIDDRINEINDGSGLEHHHYLNSDK